MAKKKGTRKGNKRAKPTTYPPPSFYGKSRTASKHDDSPFAHPHGYTLAEEARNTTFNRRGIRSSDAMLRYKPVTFISSGVMDPLKDFGIPLQKSASEQAAAAVTNPDAAHDLIPEPAISAPSGTQSLGANDVARHKLVQQCSDHPDDESDRGSDSSVEIILFKGRNADHQRKTGVLPTLTDGRNDDNSTSPPEGNLALRFVENPAAGAANSDSTPQAEEVDYIPLETPQAEEVDYIPLETPQAEELDYIPLETPKAEELDYISLETSPQPATSHKSRLNTDSDDSDGDSDIIADYIANMRDDFDDDEQNEQEIGHPGLGFHGFSILRDLGGTDSDAIPSPISSGGESEDGLDGELVEQSGEDAEDARLARLIAKQEELGLGDENVFYHDGADFDDGWIAALSAPRRKRKGSSKKTQIFHEGSQFPSATEMADALDELDLMDVQHSRLQRSKKGPISFGLSDSELEGALNMAIKKDRLKKANRKKAREKLRSQGLLGQNADPNDLRTKYPIGMSFTELTDELEAFMLGTQEQLALPPLNSEYRQIIHIIANTFNMKSKSSSSGLNRHPILYRTKKMRPYNQDALRRSLSRLDRVDYTWFPRMDVLGKADQETRAHRRAETRTLKRTLRRIQVKSRRDNKARHSNRPRHEWSLVVHEGETVGQDAAEIGMENRGRAILEKMGWSKGMGLGSVENKGIIVPLTQVMKKKRAGLGET